MRNGAVGLSAFRALTGASILLLLCVGCEEPSEPSKPDFAVDSVVFTGDSTGGGELRHTASVRVASVAGSFKGQAYCEVTVTWNPPPVSQLTYTVHRSTEPGIESGGVPVYDVGSTSDTILVDDDALQWGETYYYAVSAMTIDSVQLWSDEGSIDMPLSPYPTPSVLTAEPLQMGRCILRWTTCPDADFSRYALLRGRSFLQRDTLCVSHERVDTTFIDTLLPDYYPRTYKVLTWDTPGNRSKSEELEFGHVFELPWIGETAGGPGCEYTASIVQSEDGSMLYYGGYVYALPDDYGKVAAYDTQQGEGISRELGEFVYNVAYMSYLDALLVDYVNAAGTRKLLLLDGETLDNPGPPAEVDLECSAMAAAPDGRRALLCTGSGSAWVWNCAEMSPVDTLGFGFEGGCSLSDGLMYVWGDGLLRRLDAGTLETAATAGVSPRCTPILTDDGSLCVLDEGCRLLQLDPYSLAEISSSTPAPLALNAPVLLESSGDIYVYAELGDKQPLTIVAFLPDDWSSPGIVVFVDEVPWLEPLEDALVIAGGEQIYYTGTSYADQLVILRISS